METRNYLTLILVKLMHDIVKHPIKVLYIENHLIT